MDAMILPLKIGQQLLHRKRFQPGMHCLSMCLVLYSWG